MPEEACKGSLGQCHGHAFYSERDETICRIWERGVAWLCVSEGSFQQLLETRLKKNWDRPRGS